MHLARHFEIDIALQANQRSVSYAFVLPEPRAMDGLLKRGRSVGDRLIPLNVIDFTCFPTIIISILLR